MREGALRLKYPNAPVEWAASLVLPRAIRCAIPSRLIFSRPGYDIRTIQEVLGHRDVSKTTIYTHVLNQGGRGVQSPLDQLGPGVAAR